MRAAAECLAYIFCERADVGAFAAMDLELDIRSVPRPQSDGVDLHLAGRADDLHALAGVLVVVAAIALKRRIARRHLGDTADKARQDVFQMLARSRNDARADDLAFGVAGRCRRSEAQ